jgi:hypothetical protein
MITKGSSFVGINDKNNNKKISEGLETSSIHTSMNTSFSQSIRSIGRGIGLTAMDNLASNTGTGTAMIAITYYPF